jgi:putative DNA primase/helicase
MADNVVPIGGGKKGKGAGDPPKGTGNAMLDAALAYAARGWPVFPCSPKNKAPLLAADRDAQGNKIKGTGGVTKATTDPELIMAWWRKWPKAMIGAATGHNGLFVVDFDPGIETDPKTGEPILCPVDGKPIEYTLELLKANLCFQIGCELPASLAVRTAGKGGVHVYFRQPDEGADIRNRNCLPHRIDVRGTGGYVIVPPSVMSNGREYRWLHGDADAEPVEAPAQLVDLLRRPQADAEQTNVGASAPASSQPRSPNGKSAVPSAGGLADRPTSVAEAEEQAVRRYALAALDGEVEKARQAPNGGRNNTINMCGLALGHLVGAGALSRDLAISALVDVARAWPDLDKSTDTITRAVDDGIRDPRDLSHVRNEARERFLRYAGGGRRDPSGPSGATAFRARQGEIEQSFQSGMVADDGQAAGGSEGEGRPTASQRARAARELHAKLARYPRTDLGNAERFRDRCGDDFRFSPALGWFAWDGKRWKLLSAEANKVPGEVLAGVYKMVRAIRREAWVVKASGAWDAEKNPAGLDRLSFDEKGKPKMLSALLFAWAETSEGNARLTCIANLVRPFLTVDPDAFDRDLMAFNVQNGTLRFRRGAKRPDGSYQVMMKLFPHDRRDLLTKISPVRFDPQATSPVYDRLITWAQPDEAMRRYLHQWGGLSMTGETGEQKLHFWHGGGGNGKGTILNAWLHVVGDYGAVVGIETFLDQGPKRSGDKATPDLAKLPGVRLLRVSEPEEGAQLAEALIKLVTGQDPLSVRHLNKGFFEFLPQFKLTIMGNHWLGIRGTDRGIWRRVKLVPWEASISDADADDSLPAQLEAEASGILNHMVKGLLDWMRWGLIEPAKVTKATADYRETSDPLGRFLKLCVREAVGKRVQSSHLHNLYEAWCATQKEKP